MVREGERLGWAVILHRPHESFPMGGGTLTKATQPCGISHAPLLSSAAPSFLPRELSSQGSFAEPCLFGLPGRQLAAALITAPKWQLDLLLVCTAQAARFTVLRSFACRLCCSVPSSLAAPSATQRGERGVTGATAFPGKVKTTTVFLHRVIPVSSSLQHPLVQEEVESSDENCRSASPDPES